MTTKAIIAAILGMMGFGPSHPKTCTHFTQASQVAFWIPRSLRVERSSIRPTLLAAVAGAESTWRWKRGGDIITGRDGEVGWYQVKPDGRAKKACEDLDIRSPSGNTRCAIRLLEIARRECGPEPGNFLGRYNGIQDCGRSDYGDKILAIEARGQSKLVAEVP